MINNIEKVMNNTQEVREMFLSNCSDLNKAHVEKSLDIIKQFELEYNKNVWNFSADEVAAVVENNPSLKTNILKNYIEFALENINE